MRGRQAVPLQAGDGGEPQAGAVGARRRLARPGETLAGFVITRGTAGEAPPRPYARCGVLTRHVSAPIG